MCMMQAAAGYRGLPQAETSSSMITTPSMPWQTSCQDGNEEESDHPVRMGYNAMGQRVSMEDITGASSYTYDGLDG